MVESSLAGTTVALVTPFDTTGRLDVPALKRLVEWQIAEGIDNLLVAGTTGESATLTSSEHRFLLEVTLEQAGGRVPVVCGTGSNSTAKTLEATAMAERSGADAVLVVTPYYNKPTQDGLFEHYRAVAESTALPVIAYNVPGRTGCNLNAGTTLRLARLPNVVAVKEASGNLVQIMTVLRDRPEGFLVLSGDDAVTLPLIAAGADGVVSVVANEVPGPFSRMVRAARAGDWATARNLHFQLLDLMEVNFIESNPIPVKAALAMMGRIEEVLRLPLVPMSEPNRLRLLETLRALELVG